VKGGDGRGKGLADRFGRVAASNEPQAMSSGAHPASNVLTVGECARDPVQLGMDEPDLSGWAQRPVTDCAG
jgi:hypothetical protein